MLDCLKHLKNKSYDCIAVYSGDDDDTLEVQGIHYDDPGEPVGGSMLGHAYHILTYRIDNDGNICNHDMFDGILIDPVEYLSHLIRGGWFGMIAKKTTTSEVLSKKLFDIITQE